MASLMETLMDVLEKEDSAYEQLIELSKEKTTIIVEGNIEKLHEITEREQPIVENIQQLEQTRAEVMKDIAIVFNKDVEELKLRTIIEMLKGQPTEQERLAELHDKLGETVRMMAAINENNQMLLEHSLEMVGFEISLYQSMRKAPETANYGKDAYNKGDVLINTSGFDAKQ
ncbi:flagellar protein FlgN [Konateibacter massiliensis]|uniref:flagellar protein FlgN n=1 Tax=Konateibacter massiliensis TaxID=2002841 RepID=UPI000C15A948|nr:flagellar protein FlgN [Konateibacter massiliensis]